MGKALVMNIASLISKFANMNVKEKNEHVLPTLSKNPLPASAFATFSVPVQLWNPQTKKHTPQPTSGGRVCPQPAVGSKEWDKGGKEDKWDKGNLVTRGPSAGDRKAFGLFLFAFRAKAI